MITERARPASLEVSGPPRSFRGSHTYGARGDFPDRGTVVFLKRARFSEGVVVVAVLDLDLDSRRSQRQHLHLRSG